VFADSGPPLCNEDKVPKFVAEQHYVYFFKAKWWLLGWMCNPRKIRSLKGLSHEMDLAFDDMHGQF
jgi:hypothetical protein